MIFSYEILYNWKVNITNYEIVKLLTFLKCFVTTNFIWFLKLKRILIAILLQISVVSSTIMQIYCPINIIFNLFTSNSYNISKYFFQSQLASTKSSPKII